MHDESSCWSEIGKVITELEVCQDSARIHCYGKTLNDFTVNPPALQHEPSAAFNLGDDIRILVAPSIYKTQSCPFHPTTLQITSQSKAVPHQSFLKPHYRTDQPSSFPVLGCDYYTAPLALRYELFMGTTCSSSLIRGENEYFPVAKADRYVLEFLDSDSQDPVFCLDDDPLDHGKFEVGGEVKLEVKK